MSASGQVRQIQEIPRNGAFGLRWTRIGGWVIVNLRHPGCRGSCVGGSGGRSQGGRRGLNWGLKSQRKRLSQDIRTAAPPCPVLISQQPALTLRCKLPAEAPPPLEVCHLPIPGTQLTQIPDGPATSRLSTFPHLLLDGSCRALSCICSIIYFGKLYSVSIHCAQRLTCFNTWPPSCRWCFEKSSNLQEEVDHFGAGLMGYSSGGALQV